MHFLFNLLRIKGLYMFPALLVHPQEALHNWHLVYCVPSILNKLNKKCITLVTLYWYTMMHSQQNIKYGTINTISYVAEK
jgi:hypothetical protein